MAQMKSRGSGVSGSRGSQPAAERETSRPRDLATPHETDRNARAWSERPLLREIYAGFHRRIRAAIPAGAGAVIEIGSGIGAFPDAILTDVFVRDWLDVTCSAYRLPFRDGSARAIILFDVFHHLQRPVAALAECARVLAPGGRVIIFDVYVSPASFPVYQLHPERVHWRAPIDLSPEPPARDDAYYTAQGNATRMFFRSRVIPSVSEGSVCVGGAPHAHTDPSLTLRMTHAEAFAAWHYLLSGGFSKPALYPRFALPLLRWIDQHLPARLFGGRCLVVLEKR
jgi:SAM-dependent methyltransferase